MRRGQCRLSQVLESDYDAVIRAVRQRLAEQQQLKDIHSLVREESQRYLYEHIDRELAAQRVVYTELLREFWALHFDATPYNAKTVQAVVDEHLEHKRQKARTQVEHDLARQEEYDRIRCERFAARLRWRMRKIVHCLKAEWDSCAPLEVGLLVAASIVCLGYVLGMGATQVGVRFVGFPIGAFVGMVCAGIRATQIQEKRWRRIRETYAAGEKRRVTGS